MTLYRRFGTQPHALRLHRERPRATGLRWWSRFEATWSNVTLFDREVARLALRDARELTVRDPAVLVDGGPSGRSDGGVAGTERLFAPRHARVRKTARERCDRRRR